MGPRTSWGFPVGTMERKDLQKVAALLRQAAEIASDTELGRTIGDLAATVKASIPKPPPIYFDVAMGTPPKPCNHCDATIYFVVTSGRKRMPVRCDVEGGVPPTAIFTGRGLSHFSDCPGADAARNPR